MNIGILQTAYKKSNEYGSFYNVQVLGLGRALAKCGHQVYLYKGGVDGESSERYEYDGRFTIKLISLKYIGINGLFNPNTLDKQLDLLFYFCDTQLVVPNVYKWCHKNNVTFVPYIGVIESHSENIIKRIIMRYATLRNVNIYKKYNVYAKTPDIQQALSSVGCKNTTLFPVGLDETVMKEFSSLEMLSYTRQHVDSLLFIGRMEDEKQPLEMIRIYDELLNINAQQKLTMIGDGYLYNIVESRLNQLITKHALPSNQAILLRKVKYDDMYRYYRASSCYVNLNEVEILGMSILEAMYYGCPVFAINAPDPNYILCKDGVEQYGIIATDCDDLTSKLISFVSSNNDTFLNQLSIKAQQRVRRNFLWSSNMNRFPI